MKKTFYYAFEIVIMTYIVIISVLLLIFDTTGSLIFQGYHVLGVTMITLLAYAEKKYGGTFWKGMRYWLVIFFIMALFRELHHIIPKIHPFEDHSFDAALMRLDQKLFGDVPGPVEKLWWPPFIEFLHLCYWTYFPLPAVLAFAFWRTGRMRDFRHFGTIYLSGMYIGYLMYMIVPSVGPYYFEPRSEKLNGVWIGGTLDHWLHSLELITADAFPSLHTLAAGLVMTYSWKAHRKVFWLILIPATGLILSTVILRYHYLVDIVAGLALVPVALVVGDFIFRLWEGEEKESPRVVSAQRREDA